MGSVFETVHINSVSIYGILPILDVRHRYDFLFGLIQNSGLRISEALAVKVRDVRLDNMLARTARVIGKGDKERLVPLPVAFGQVLAVWINGRGGGGVRLRQEGARRKATRGGSSVGLPAASFC